MLKKLRVEAGTYDFAKRTILWFVLCAVIIGGYYRTFAERCPGGAKWEFVIYVLTNHDLVLLFLTVLLLAFTSARAGEARRYPILLRYRSRSEALAARLGARVFFALFMVLSLAGMLGIAGSGFQVRGNLYPQAESMGYIYVIACQCLNILCYFNFILLLREILQNLFRNTALELFFTLLIPIVTRGAVLKDQTRLVLISPWGSIAYMLAYNLPDFQTVNELNIIVEVERPDYRFYWQYWLAVQAVLFCIAVWLERNRDYVFDQHRRGG